MLKLKFQYFGHLMRRANSLEKTLMLEKIEVRRRRGGRGVVTIGLTVKIGQRMGWLDGLINSVDMSLSKFWEMVKDKEALHATDHGFAKSQM